MQISGTPTVSAPRTGGRRFFSITALVWLCCLVLLASVVTIPGMTFRVLLWAIFLLTGFAVLRNPFFSYLVFLAVYPLIPSRLGQIGLPEFSAAEFLFLSFAFWWATGKLIFRKSDFPAPAIQPLFGYQLGYLALSAFGFLVTATLLFSRVFLLQLQDHWNLFVPFVAGDPFGSLRAFLTQAEGILSLFIALDVVLSQPKIERVAKMIFYSAAGVSILGVLQYVLRFRLLEFWVKENPNLIRINSTMDDPNSLGAYLVVSFCIGLYAVSSRSRVQRVFHFAALAVIFVALLLSASRSSIGAAFLAAILLPYCLKLAALPVHPREAAFTRYIGKIAWVSMFVFALLVGFAAYKNYSTEKPSNWMEFLLTSLNPLRPVDAILKGRTALWHTAIRLFRRNPILGAGVGSFFYQISKRPYDFPELRIAENAHNYYLQVLAETGIVGLLLLLAILVIILVPAFRSLRKSAPDVKTYQVYGLMGGVLVFVITSFTGHPLLLPKMQYLFWVIAALLLISGGILERRRIASLRGLLTGITVVVILMFSWQMISAARSAKLSAYEIGYYPWERDSSQRLFRWTSNRGISDLVVESDTLSFEIRQINKKFLQKPWPVDLYINDRLIKRVFLKDSRWTPLQYKVDAKQGSRIRFAIKPSGTFSPEIGGIVDRRKLGVQITPFHWTCPTSYTSFEALGIVRGEKQIVRISALPLEGYQDPQKLDILGPAGESLSYLPNSTSIYGWSSSSVSLYHAETAEAAFTVDSSKSLVVKEQLRPGNAIFRIVGDATCKSSRIPLLYVSKNGKQTATIPFYCSSPNSYYFQMPLSGAAEELTFSSWDGLSEVTPATEAHIRISDVRVWPGSEFSGDQSQSGWSEMQAIQYQLLESSHSSPVSLHETGQFFQMEKDWRPGIAFLVVDAAASIAGNEFPRIGIFESGQRLGSITVESPETREYRFRIPLAGREQLRLVFENDYFDESRHEDRNVVLFDVRVEYPPAITIAETIDDFLLSGDSCFLITQKNP